MKERRSSDDHQEGNKKNGGNLQMQKLLLTTIHKPEKSEPGNDCRAFLLWEIIRVFNRWREKIRIRSFREIFQPAARIHQVHTRSFSRTTVVSIPFRNPRIALIFFIGANSIRLA